MTLEELQAYCREGMKASAAVRGRMDAEKKGLQVDIQGEWPRILEHLYRLRASEVLHDDKMIIVTTWMTWPVVEDQSTTLFFEKKDDDWVLTQAQG